MSNVGKGCGIVATETSSSSHALGSGAAMANAVQTPAQSLQTIGALSSGIMHEINTPIQYITDNVKFLNDAVSQFATALNTYEKVFATLPEETKTNIDFGPTADDLSFLVEETPEAASHALSGLEHVSNIIAAVKSFAHPTRDEKTLVDIADIIKTTVTVSRNEWKYAASLDTSFDDGLPLIPCHPTMLHQVLLNLITNAVHAIEEKEGSEQGSINIHVKMLDTWLEIRIADDGCGVSQINAAKIMEPFFTTKPAGKGSGQGLALCRSIIEDKHNGEITFESELGVGSTFKLRLPIKGSSEIPGKNGRMS
ncbi:MAG: HAMP domain-containing sensor histidine kinase [Pseudomonadota bacterium]